MVCSFPILQFATFFLLTVFSKCPYALFFGSFPVKLMFGSLTPAHYTQNVLPTIYVKSFFVIFLLKVYPVLPLGFCMFNMSGFQPFQVFGDQNYSGGVTGSCTPNLSPPDIKLCKKKLFIYLSDPLKDHRRLT